MNNTSVKLSTTIKSEIAAIAYSAVVKQIVKLAKSNAEANRRLLQMGQEIGQRVADQFSERQTNSYKPEEVSTCFLKGILKEYLGCEVTVGNLEISYQKARFTIRYRVIVRENPLCDFIVLGKGQGKDLEGESLNYHSIIMGFINGTMKSMAYHPTVTLVSDSLQIETIQISSSALISSKETVFDVEMWKEKEED